jgi:transposase
VPRKSVDQQAVLMLHKTRDLPVRQRTALINALRAHLSEYGIVTSKEPGGVRDTRCRRISPAKIGPNLFHQCRTVS